MRRRQRNLVDVLIAKACPECLRGQELRVYAARAFALLRLRRLTFAFFEIAIELLDQVQDGWRLTVIIGGWY